MSEKKLDDIIESIHKLDKKLVVIDEKVTQLEKLPAEVRKVKKDSITKAEAALVVGVLTLLSGAILTLVKIYHYLT